VPRYLIHVGPHMTGATHLQHALARLRPELAARGVVYPDSWGETQGHHRLAAALAGGDEETLTTAFDQFNRSGADTVVLSSETFARSTDADLRRLQHLLAGQPVTAIFYCRRWSELIPSCWHDAVRHGSLMTLPEFALPHLSDPLASPIINFAHVLARYAAVFGPGVLRIVSYNGVLEAGKDLSAHFCQHFLGWPRPPATGLERIDATLDMVDSEIIRALNALEWTRAREDRQRLFDAFQAEKTALPVRWLVEKSMQYTVDCIRIDDATPTLASLHADLAERYKAALVPPFPVSALFRPRCTDVDYVRADYLFADGVIETLREIQMKLLRLGRLG
jgi:hypothetical protein